jgi:uridine kinase
VIGIAGGSGSGKTFFLKCFLHHFSPGEVCLVSQDDYYLPAGEMSREENKHHNFDLPAAIDAARFIQDIHALLRYETVYKEEYTFNNPSAAPRMLEIKPAPLLIVEGLFILHFREIAGLLDQKIFIDTEEEVALNRRLKRDFNERGYSRDEVMYKWLNHVLPAYRAYLLPYRNECGKVIANNTDVAAHILAAAEVIAGELRNAALPEKFS